MDGVRVCAENVEEAAVREATWREVESRETRMEPTLPGRPAVRGYKHEDVEGRAKGKT